MPDYYSIEVTLKEVTPRIWRRFMIRKDAIFIHLHEAIQDGAGWMNRHSFQFRNARGNILAGLPDGPDDVTTPDARINPIEKVFGSQKGKRIQYIYDLGDSWDLDVEVVDLDEENPRRFGRMLLAGERAFPPEDCGGIKGYLECREVVLGQKKDRKLLVWLKGWHPERFNIAKAKRPFFRSHLRPYSRYREECH